MSDEKILDSQALIEETISIVKSSIAFLEAGHYILNIALGLKRLDTSALQLQRILETVQPIEGKIETVLDTSLKMSRDFLEAAYNAIANDSFEFAYKIIANDLIPKASEAFNLEQKDKITPDNFYGCMQSIKILVLANVLVHSYSRKRFQPYKVLSKKKKKLIADELERIVNKAISLKKKVYKKQFLMHSEDSLDSVLQVASSGSKKETRGSNGPP